MKWVFGILAVLNVALFLWATGQRTPTEQDLMPRPSINAEAMPPLPARAPPDRAPAPERAEPPQPTRSCYSLGPFADAGAAQPAVTALADAGVEYAERIEREQVVVGYRVLVGPLASAEAAQRMHERLTAAGVRGHYVIRAGLKNAVAVGFFAQLDKAEQMVRRLGARGIDAYLKVRRGPGGELHWLDFRADPKGDILKRLAESDWGGPRTVVRARACP